MSRRIALLIANSEYDDSQLSRLRTPTRDAERLAEVLGNKAIGDFDVSLLINRPLLDIRRAVARLYRRKKRDDLLLLYYSGHGIRPEHGELYLAVKDTEREIIEATALDATFVRGLIDRSQSRRKVVILDSCHSGAFGEGAKSLGDSVGAKDAFAGSGYGRVILTASDALEYAWEQDKLVGDSEMSVFTRYLVEGLETGAADLDGDGDVTPDELYDYIHDQMLSASSRQEPQRWAQKGVGRIIVARNPNPPKPELPKELQEDLHSPYPWRRAGVVGELKRLLNSPDTGLSISARAALERLLEDDSRQVSTAAAAALGQTKTVEPVPPPQPRPGETGQVGIPIAPSNILTLTTPIHMELVRVSAGEFLMGSDPAKDKDADDNEQPQHTVYLSGYYIGKYPVTNTQYAAFVQTTSHKSAGWKGIPNGKKDHPVVNVSWHDAVAFCKWLSEESGYDSKLPTEAQWEKAARGTDGRIYPWGNEWDAAKANTKEGGPGGTTPVGRFSPGGDSPYEVSDMAGNIWEWCFDDWNQSAYQVRDKETVRDPQGTARSEMKVLRGGSWYSDYTLARCADRYRFHYPYYWDNYRGFRVACAPLPSDL